jgi:hypothetical protein
MNCEKCQQNFIEANKWREKAIKLKDALEYLRDGCLMVDIELKYPELMVKAMDDSSKALEAFNK